MKKRIKDKLKSWMNGEVDFSLNEEAPRPQVKLSEDVSALPETIPELESKERKLSRVWYGILAAIACVTVAAVLVYTVVRMPEYSSSSSPVNNEVYEKYVGQGRDDTGAVSSVAAMILDYRAFDTLGESFVLFTATCSVLILMSEKRKRMRLSKPDAIDYSKDIIVSSVCMIIIPVILVIGAYIVLNGHLSPGGGFAGGAVLGSGFILYAVVYGEKRADAILSEKTVKTVICSSLCFYCLAKSYSFFTGNEMNGVESVISGGTPGDLLSSGLILPLNIAVGLIVCCTMYSFYMLFKRGNV